MLANQLTRHSSEFSFARYSKRALEIKAQEQVYAVFEKTDKNRNSSD